MKDGDVKESNILDDCARLLRIVINSNKGEGWIEVFIGKVNKNVIFSRFHDRKIYGYRFNRTPLKLQEDAVFDSLSRVKESSIPHISILKNKRGMKLSITSKLIKTENYDQEFNVGTNGIEGLIKVKLTRFSAEKWLGDHGFYSVGEEFKYFGFNQMTFTLKRIDAEPATINFNPSKGDSKNTYYLFYAFVDILKDNPEREGLWIKKVITFPEIVDNLRKQKIPEADAVDKKWIRYTKGNLKRKIPADFESLIEIGNCKNGGYPFALKLPL